MVKNNFLFLLIVVFCSFSLSGCLLDDPRDGTIKSIQVSPDRINKTETTGNVTVTVELDIPLTKVSKNQSYPFVKDGAEEYRGRGTQEPEERGKNTLVYQIQKSWLSQLSVGSYNVGFVLQTDTSILKVDDKSMGNFVVEK